MQSPETNFRRNGIDRMTGFTMKGNVQWTRSLCGHFPANVGPMIQRPSCSSPRAAHSPFAAATHTTIGCRRLIFKHIISFVIYLSRRWRSPELLLCVHVTMKRFLIHECLPPNPYFEGHLSYAAGIPLIALSRCFPSSRNRQTFLFYIILYFRKAVCE